MGAVYVGRDEDDRLVAVKVIRPELAADPTYRARFRDEVSNAQRVASFCTAQVMGHGLEGGRPYLVTEYVDGEPLETYIESQGALPSGTLHGVAVGVAAALTAIHSTGLIHRDLKPSNVLLSVSGPRVIDFGIARATDVSPTQHTQDGIVIGTPGWMAPEQVLRGEIGTAVDIFAWGTLVALAGTGRHPYGTGSAIAMAARAGEGRPDLHGLAEPLHGLVTRALHPEPDRRPTAQQLLLSLVGGTTGLPVGDAQTVADRELDRTWRAEPPMVPPKWVPPSPPHGTPAGTRQYTAAAPLPTAPPPAPVGPPRPPPTQPPLILPAYAGNRRPRRRRSRLLGCSVTVVILLAVAIGALAVLSALTRPTDGTLGRPAKDGQFTFVVQSPIRCGRNATIAGLASNAGKLCQVRFKVENTGTKNRALTPDWQKLLDSADTKMAGVKLLEGTAPRVRNEVTVRVLKPGEAFTGFVIFDVPAAYQPTAVVLHDAAPSRGVRVPNT
jgi:serine/threonine protein kinase